MILKISAEAYFVRKHKRIQDRECKDKEIL